MAGIFNIDWDNVVINLTPWFWRETKDGNEMKLIPYLRSVIAPVQDISDDLNTLQEDTEDFLQYTGQHKVLEEYLNNTYDPTLRRIYITENDIAGLVPLTFYQSGETNPSPLTFYQSGEVNPAPLTFYQSNEGVSGNNFTIHIPVAVSYDTDVLTAQMRNYVEASKNFNIVTF